MINLESKFLIDYFALCGLDIKNGLESEPNESYEETINKPPLERSYKCKILYHFPENLPWNQFDEYAVTQLCLPKGLVFQKHNSKPKFHPFLITREDGSRVYGATLKFFELIEDESICNAMQTLQTMYDAENSTSKVVSSASIFSSNTNRHYHSRGNSVNVNSSSSMIASSISSSGPTDGPSSIKPRYSSSSSSRTTISIISPISFRSNSQNENDYLDDSGTSTTNNPSQFIESFSNNNGTNVAIHDNILKLNNGQSKHVQALQPRTLLLNGKPPIFSNVNNTSNSMNNQNSPSVSSPTKIPHYNMLKDRLYASKCICVISQYPFNKAFQKILNTLYDMVEKTDLLGINLESHLYNLIYELQMPAYGKVMKFHIGCKASSVYFPDYQSGHDMPLLDYDLFEFFRLLGVNNMINLYITALLEHQILLYSKDYYLLMLVAESLTSLLFPFSWVKTYVPIVPASNLHFIEAPLPYIMGFHHKDIDKEFFKQGQRCFVDIDSGTVSCPEGLPEFPDKNKFIKEIDDLIVYFHEKRTKLKSKQQQQLQQQGQQKQPGNENFFVSKKSSSSEVGNENATPSTEVVMESAILENSQAFARIAELAIKAGAMDSNQDYYIDPSTGRLKAVNRYLSVDYSSLRTCSSSSGYSTESNENDANQQNVISRNNSDLSAKLETKNCFDDEEILCGQFSACVRELFLQKFVQMFVSYEKFVIVPNFEPNQIETWWVNREHPDNFDSKMFLIEQPSPRLPFLSHFISTQMFVSFIDLKIMAMIDNSKSPDPNVKIFDSKIKNFRESDLFEIKPSADLHKTFVNIEDIEKEIHKKLTQEPLVAPNVHVIRSIIENKLDPNQRTDALNESSKYLFENVDANLLKADEEFIQKIHNEMKQRKESLLKNSEQYKNSELKLSLEKKPKSSVKEKKSRGLRVKKPTNGSESNEKSTELNPIFIQSLLKESKTRTKRMLVEKMPEVANLGHGESRISGIEENMLIASLCDLIERIWGHGLHNKAGKSALWNHLINYRKLIQCLHPNSLLLADTKTTSPTLLWCLMKKKANLNSNIFTDKTNNNPNNENNQSSNNNHTGNSKLNDFNHTSNKSSISCGSSTLPRKRNNLTITHEEIVMSQQTPHAHNLSLNRHHHGSATNLHNYSNAHKNHKRASSVNNENQNTFPPLKNDLLADLSRIDKLTEVRTEIGMARAFVRLSLEKKLLADHLRQLLSEAELLRALYKRHAFLRQEDEREQFIYHLQSLNVVDYFCFTNHFRSIPTDYSVLIVPSKKFNSSYTSANAYIKLFGSLGESEVFFIPKNAYEFVISNKCNLGPLTTLVIGHDNAGITPKWMIECIFVRNEITGHINKFPCGRWLGKGVDDDSLERLLIAEPIDHNEAYDLPNIQLLSPYSSNATRSRSPTIIRSDEKKLNAPAIQELLGNSINTLVKYFEKSETERGSLTSLMCGENGLVFSMDQIFSFGYKTYKLFKRLYVWDFFEKAMNEFENILYSNSKYANSNQKSNKELIIEKYISCIKSINSISANYGKDGKFQIFICLACRDSFVSDWFYLLSKSNTVSQMYDEYSFLRNHELNKFSMKLLSITNQFNFKLENSLTMGINY